MLEKLLALIERAVDALEVIAASKTGNDAPRVEKPDDTATTADKSNGDALKAAAAADDAKKKAADERAAKAAAKKKADEEKAAAAKAASASAAAEDPLADPLGGDTEAKTEYTDKDVRDILAKVIDQDGRTVAFAILKEKGGGAKNFTELKKEHYEDVYVACKDKVGE